MLDANLETFTLHLLYIRACRTCIEHCAKLVQNNHVKNSACESNNTLCKSCVKPNIGHPLSQQQKNIVLDREENNLTHITYLVHIMFNYMVEHSAHI